MDDRQPADREDRGSLDRTRFVEADDERFERALAVVLAELTPAERLLGKVDERGEVIWGGCPRAMFKPETVPWSRLILPDADADPAADAGAEVRGDE